MTAPFTGWSDADLLAILTTHARILRHRDPGGSAAVACWTDVLREYESAVQHGPAARLATLRPVLAALARAYADPADLGAWDYLIDVARMAPMLPPTRKDDA